MTGLSQPLKYLMVAVGTPTDKGRIGLL